MGHLLQDCHHIANLQITSYKIMQSHASLCLIHNPFGILYKKRGLNFTYFMVQKLEGKKGEVFIHWGCNFSKISQSTLLGGLFFCSISLAEPHDFVLLIYIYKKSYIFKSVVEILNDILFIWCVHSVKFSKGFKVVHK